MTIAIDNNQNKWIGTFGGVAVYKQGGVIFGVNEITDGQSVITLYPNPAFDNISVKYPYRSEISVLNIQGQTILQQSLQEGKTDIDIRGLEPGIYILKLNSNSKTLVTRFTKE